MMDISMFKQEGPRRTMVRFKYVDFYDVPRLIMFRYLNHLFLLGSYFDEDKDGYDENYSIELLPSWVEQKIADSSWRVLEDDISERRLLGEISVKDVVFDSTKRQALDPTFLNNICLLARTPRRAAILVLGRVCDQGNLKLWYQNR